MAGFGSRVVGGVEVGLLLLASIGGEVTCVVAVENDLIPWCIHRGASQATDRKAEIVVEENGAKDGREPIEELGAEADDRNWVDVLFTTFIAGLKVYAS